MKCDLCNKTATIHITVINDIEKISKHLCREHGDGAMPQQPAAGSSPIQTMVNGVACTSPQEAAVRGVLDNMRGARNFLRDHVRMPATVEELLKGMAAPDEVPVAVIDDSKLRQEFERLDGQVRFIQHQGRLPQTPDEYKSLGY